MNTPMVVVGGAYGEECSFPQRQVFRGSGGRAAAILASLGAEVVLSTVTGPELGATFQSIAAKLGYELKAREGSQDIWFRYRHPLARPTIFPMVIERPTHAPPIEADLALVFGMVEGRLPIRARRVVYDPQDGFAAKAFGENGSTAAGEVAIVLSYSEGLGLTGKKEPAAMASILLSQPGVSVFPYFEGLQNRVRRRVLCGIFLRLASRRPGAISSGMVCFQNGCRVCGVFA
jgi:hypothetical protein